MAHIAWDKGGEATVVAASANAITLRSSVPSPPGSRILGTLEDESSARLATPDAARASVRIKIHASRLQSDGSFVLEGRPLDLTREMRERLERLAATSTPR